MAEENLRVVDETAVYQDYVELENENRPPTPKDERRINKVMQAVTELEAKFAAWKEEEYREFYD